MTYDVMVEVGALLSARVTEWKPRKEIFCSVFNETCCIEVKDQED